MRIFAGLLASLLATVTMAQTYSIFSPGPSGPVKSNGSYALQAEVSADIIGLWTGTCSATTFLKGAGACGQVNLATDVTGQLTVPNGGTGVATLTGLVLGNGTSAFTPYGGNGCTNQFIRSLSSAGVATCNTVSLTADVTGTLGATNGGTSFSTFTLGDLLYSSATNTLAKLAGNTTTAQLFLSQTGNGTVSAAPVWSTLPGSFTGFANPTGTTGLTAVNGAATTAMRSDAAPPLSQAIVPTWTGTHTFANTTTQQILNNSGAAVDAKNTEVRISSGGSYAVSSATDAAPTTAVTNLISATRTGTAWSTLSLGNATDNTTFTVLGSGAETFNGPATFSATAATNVTITNNGSTNSLVVAGTTGRSALAEFAGNGTSAGTTSLAIGQDSTGANHLLGRNSASLLIGTNGNNFMTLDANGHLTMTAPTAGGQSAYTFHGRNANNALLIDTAAGAGTAFGVVVQAGSTSADYNLLLQSQAGGQLMELFGDGGLTVGSPTGGDKGAGSVNAQSLWVQGQPVSPVNVIGSCSAGGCTALRASGASTTITRTSAGVYTVTFTSTFPLQPVCQLTPTSTAGFGVTNATTTSTAVNTYIISAGSAVATDMIWNLTCY